MKASARFGPRRLIARLVLAAAALAATSGHAWAAPPSTCPTGSRLSVLDGALPRFVARFASERAMRIVTIGSSSTAGAGASSPAKSYPSRLAAELRLRYPGRDIEVINAGANGQEVPDMLARLDRDVLSHRPDLVIWQFGSNGLLRRRPVDSMEQAAHDGIVRIQSAGVDVVMMDLQHAPRIDGVAARDEVLGMMERLRRSTGAALFHRYRLMKAWASAMGPNYRTMVSGDGLHMTDASYGCLAGALADGIAAAVSGTLQAAVATRNASIGTMNAKAPWSQPR
jgi:lysophospholipase L1-like esterase